MTSELRSLFSPIQVGRLTLKNRIYSSAHAERLQFVRRARDLGLSLDDVRRLLGLADQKSRSCGKVQNLAAHHLADIRARIADLKRMERVLSRLVNACAKGELPSCPLLEALAHPDGNPEVLH